MQAEWWLVLTLVLFGFIVSWFFFAFLYFLVSVEHGDFDISEDDQFYYNQTNSIRSDPKEREKCVQDVHNFLSALLFSIETQHTIGYGSRYITTECMGGILVLTLQSSLGYLLHVIVTQVVFTKLSRPTEKSQFIVFSDNALIAPRNNHLTLTFRIGNLSPSQLIFASVRLLMIRQRRTLEDEVIPHYLYDMEITHLRNGQLFFPRPNVIEHIINYRSPLYGIQRSTLASEHFELIAIIEGSFDYTGFSCHFRTSYLPSELLWGYEFSSCNSTLSGFDFERFNQVQLIHAQPIWNYQEDDLEKNSPLIPIPTPYLYPKHFSTTSQRENLPRRKSSNDFPKKFNRLETIESVIDTNVNKIPLIDAEDEQNDEEKVSLKLGDSFVKHVEFE
ncbi:unnamed protein product [Adineta ricciae]|uniref:Uncharacterized protein n=1 Tax=Adineta ricciae TaxID=249248 RepID=A0A815AR40_ADIRI|nr:unnamed protein product [Adineta ricciae]